MGNFIPVEPEKWAEMVKALAEVERLKEEVEHIKFWNGQLKAENDLLRKAGDAMAYRVDDMMGVSKEYAQQMLNDWNAAKECKPSV